MRLLVLLVLLSSCGARRVSTSSTSEKQISKTEVEIVDTSKTVTVTDTNVKVVDSSSVDEFVVEPLDSSKVSVYNNKTFKNVRLTHRKVRINKVVTGNKNVQHVVQNAVKTNIKDNIVSTKEINSKDTKRSSSYWWMLWFLLLIPAYVIYKND